MARAGAAARRRRQVQVGEYALDPGITPRQLLLQHARRQGASATAFTIVEGWNIRQLRAALAKRDAAAADSRRRWTMPR